MILLKSDAEIEVMSEAGKIVAGALKLAKENIRPGITTLHLDRLIEKYIRSRGAVPSFKGYGGFPGSACISVNEVVIHGIPGMRILEDGDIVGVDVGVYYKGFHGDAARTFAVGEISEKARKLIEVTEQSFFEGVKYAAPGYRLEDISFAIQQYAEANGFSVVRKFIGHGIGRSLHEGPDVPNYGKPGHGMRLKAGMVIAIEPMINEGTHDVRILSDGWTAVTADGKLSAHYENTVAITKDGPEILTLE